MSQLHARAIQRLRVALGPETDPKSAARIMTEALAAFRQKPKMLKAQLATAPALSAQPLRAVAGAVKAPNMPAFARTSPPRSRRGPAPATRRPDLPG